MRPSSPGFTLVEVMVALTVGAVVLLAAHRIFAGVLDGSRALVEARETLDREANARRWLKATFLSLDAPFEGKPERASFNSWQLAPGGWFEERRIELRHQGDRLVALGSGEPLELANDVTDLAFDYLLDPGADSKWVREWISQVSAPVAVRIRIARCPKGLPDDRGRQDAGCADTLLFLIKERG